MYTRNKKQTRVARVHAWLARVHACVRTYIRCDERGNVVEHVVLALRLGVPAQLEHPLHHLGVRARLERKHARLGVDVEQELARARGDRGARVHLRVGQRDEGDRRGVGARAVVVELVALQHEPALAPVRHQLPALLQQPKLVHRAQRSRSRCRSLGRRRRTTPAGGDALPALQRGGVDRRHHHHGC